MLPAVRTVRVPLGNRSYNIKIGSSLLSRLGEECARLKLGERCAIITDTNVGRRYAKPAYNSLLKAGFNPALVTVAAGETAKSLRSVHACYDQLAAHRLERKSFIVALGGGVVGDLAGFVAACYQRGINYVQIPTTLLAQIDSSVGGKTAVNHKLGKNLIGAFHQPRTVIIDPQTLATLPKRELRAGLYEALKYGVIWDEKLFALLRNQLANVFALDAKLLIQIIARCCEIKAEVVTADERESGLRRILNFGHTVGHALESVTEYRRLKHGEAVGYGMQCASTIAEKAGIIPPAESRAIQTGVDELAQVGQLKKLPRIDDLKIQQVIAAMAHDKKVAQGKLPLILPTKIGEVIVRDDIPPTIIRAAVRELLS